MSVTKDVSFSLKVVINKQKTKVLFAEAESDFVDILISFLTLPLGTIVKILKKHYKDEEAPVKIGSLTSLYNGIENLDSDNFWSDGLHDVLLNPTSSFGDECLQLKLDISDSQPTKYFTCNPSHCRPIPCLSVYYDTVICGCSRIMKKEVGQNKSEANGVFTINTMSFIISDDLRVLPNMMGFVQTLKDLGVTDTNGTELRNVTFGFNEIMDLLKASLLSRTPLTDIILNKSQMYGDSARTKYEPGVPLDRIDKKATPNSKKMNLKVILQKSSNKLLFAQAEDDFVDFLLCFLTIPLGGIEHLLGSNTCLKSIDNLHKSVADLISDKYLVCADTKNRLMNPKLFHGYSSENFILPLNNPTLVLPYSWGWGPEKFSSINFAKGQGKYVRGPRMYKIADDLTVTPFCMASTISTLEYLNIPLSDIKEMEFQIGLEEALSILKASLTSTSVLSDAMKINPMLMKQPKQEPYC
ncbi:hypothetical protein ABFS83_13G018100 [Erythranthe nasuta]